MSEALAVLERGVESSRSVSLWALSDEALVEWLDGLQEHLNAVEALRLDAVGGLALSNGGTTDLSNAVLLCYHHHNEIHTTQWEVWITTDGLPEFIPPPYLDPERKPRRNQYHRRQ